MRAFIVFSILISVCALPAWADGNTDLPRTETEFIDLSGACNEPLANAEFFPAALQVAKESIRNLCSGAVRFSDPNELFAHIIGVAEALEREAGKVTVPWSVNPDFDEISLDAFAQQIIDDIRTYEAALRNDAAVDSALGVPSILFTTQTVDGPANLSHGNYTATPTSQSACDAAIQAVVSGHDCNAYLNEFERIYTSISRFYSTTTAVPTWRALQQLDQEWTEFMNETVDQTPLELLWNGYWFRREYGDARALVGPPEIQQIFLKPYIAADYLGEAPDGSQLNETVVLDIWGLKRWNSKGVPWYKPLGFSVHTAYSDRPTVKDWGIGLSIHFTETNTIGLTSFDGDIGVFLSFDLWKNATKAYAEGQERVTEFRMRRDDYRERLKSLENALDGG